MTSRLSHYRSLFTKILDECGNNFENFVQNHDVIVLQGTRLIELGMTTGFNIIIYPEYHKYYVPYLSKNLHIFYAHDITSVEHFAILISDMENEGIIKEADFKVGIRAVKYLWGGSIKAPRIQSSIEVVLTFSPNREGELREDVIRRAAEIVRYLNKRTFKHGEDPIQDSWIVPDIRISSVLAPTLLDHHDLALVEIVGNYKMIDDRLLFVLHRTEFQLEDWQHLKLAVDEEFTKYQSKHSSIFRRIIKKFFSRGRFINRS